MSAEQLEELVARGVLRRVEPDLEASGIDLETARRHLETAQAIMEADEVGSLAIAYEAARKAITAHLRANGLRVVAGEGAHARVGEYAFAALDDASLVEHLRAFDRMRRLRNRSQYDAMPVDQGDAMYALEHARAIVAAVEGDLS